MDQLLAVAVVPASAMVETLYRATEKGHRLATEELHEALLEMELVVEPVTGQDVVRTAQLIAASRAGEDPGAASLSLGDGLCIAAAERLCLPITGGDQYWETLDLAVKHLPFR